MFIGSNYSPCLISWQGSIEESLEDFYWRVRDKECNKRLPNDYEIPNEYELTDEGILLLKGEWYYHDGNKASNKKPFIRQLFPVFVKSDSVNTHGGLVFSDTLTRIYKGERVRLGRTYANFSKITTEFLSDSIENYCESLNKKFKRDTQNDYELVIRGADHGMNFFIIIDGKEKIIGSTRDNSSFFSEYPLYTIESPSDKLAGFYNK